ncbi:hypothetical protein Pcinc_018010 [Petrolisthes cinctipes]|uniref:Uncharacterized protein n=1 Tax=Petrolisthes cinctipes TaxID=88211 RepID=A0AAE1KN70_PETCI|nr:hypothetical protein Pcinc_018010 [Petrolisthes cinctipes]
MGGRSTGTARQNDPRWESGQQNAGGVMLVPASAMLCPIVPGGSRASEATGGAPRTPPYVAAATAAATTNNNSFSPRHPRCLLLQKPHPLQEEHPLQRL